MVLCQPYSIKRALPSKVDLRYRAMFPIANKRALSEMTETPVELVFNRPFCTRFELEIPRCPFPEIDFLKE